MGCVTCGRVGEHADWCSWVNKAIGEAARGEKPKPWWPWWLESYAQPGQQPESESYVPPRWRRGAIVESAGR